MKRDSSPGRELIAVQEATRFGELENLKFSLTDDAGWVAGTAAADHAELGVHKKLRFPTTS